MTMDFVKFPPHISEISVSQDVYFYFVLVCIPHSAPALYSLTFDVAVNDHEIEMKKTQIGIHGHEQLHIYNYELTNVYWYARPTSSTSLFTTKLPRRLSPVNASIINCSGQSYHGYIVGVVNYFMYLPIYLYNYAIKCIVRGKHQDISL